jgi:hypothetical protein
MHRPKILTCVLLAAATAACAEETATDRDAELLAGLENQAEGDSKADGVRDLRASHCEVFVDKAFTETRSRHGVHGSLIWFHAKILPWRLDGAPVRVSLFTRGVNLLTGEEFGWHEQPFDRIAGDYYRLKLSISFDGGPSSGRPPDDTRYEGAFFVETDRGTRYWANAQVDGPNFFLDENLANDLIRVHGNRLFGLEFPPEFGSEGSLRLDSFAVTADVMPYLNPQRCR